MAAISFNSAWVSFVCPWETGCALWLRSGRSWCGRFQRYYVPLSLCVLLSFSRFIPRSNKYLFRSFKLEGLPKLSISYLGSDAAVASANCRIIKNWWQVVQIESYKSVRIYRKTRNRHIHRQMQLRILYSNLANQPRQLMPTISGYFISFRTLRRLGAAKIRDILTRKT